MKRLIFIIAFLLIPSLASAGQYVIRGGVPYWYSNGCYTRAKYYQPAPAPLVVAPVSKSAAELAAGLAQWSADHQLLSSVISKYMGAPVGASYQSSSYVQRGNSVYGSGDQSGYSLQSFATVTPQPLDVEALMERATRLASQAQDHGATATAQAQGLLGQAQAGQQAIAQTFAQAARELSVLQSLQPVQPQEVKTETQFHATASAGTGPAQPPNADPPLSAKATATSSDDYWPRVQTIVTTKCSTCHDQESPDGGFNLAGDVRAFSKDQWAMILARVTNKDSAKRMPLAADHSAGIPLASSEIGDLTQAWGSK